ncbi:response regulator [Treponema succinifaciens]|uniref:Response regulator receiver protein n=1 Tax=Treponema succinifaciens (strain ATCC 33096 / DSM 2489 / 6091) TaxID=869209 RepID=F2NRM5_TRES6|nr:response regulator [Treponema succinifaciens]AEB13843.1 response regulator receiver protein [Treponema succinifaciens DSM 2489]MCI6913359.1 response regulator [Treponema succinifaciens]MDD6961278.1 response regulator [Treponema succinifaciens]MDY2616190.1 response regulator [Treponema succinifaciens]MDY5116210.1 response regulator [Treponema succinifaciens]
MDKILFVANISKTASDIFNSLSKNYEIIMQDFNKIVLPGRAAEMQPDLIAVYSNELSHEDVQAYQKIVTDEKSKNFPIIFIGNKFDYKDYIMPWGGSIIGIIITPTPMSNIIEKISIALESMHTKRGDKIKLKKPEQKTDSRKHILIVDDDPVMLRALISILKESYKTTVAKSGTSAISLLGTQKPDLILLDYMMPVCDGIQTLQMIRSEEKTKDIPVFFLTGVSDTESVKSAMSLKPEGYILKSMQPKEILKRIDDFFEKNETN